MPRRHRARKSESCSEGVLGFHVAPPKSFLRRQKERENESHRLSSIEQHKVQQQIALTAPRWAAEGCTCSPAKRDAWTARDKTKESGPSDEASDEASEIQDPHDFRLNVA